MEGQLYIQTDKWTDENYIPLGILCMQGIYKNQVLFENQYVCLRGNDLKINKYAEEEISNNYSKICFIDIRKSKVL